MFADLPRRQVNQKVIILQIYAKFLIVAEERFCIDDRIVIPGLIIRFGFPAKAGIQKIIFILTPKRKGFLKFITTFIIRLRLDSIQFNHWILHNALRYEE